MYDWHHALWQKLLNSYTQHRFHHAQLFIGAAGVGKYDLAVSLSHTLLCEQPDRFMACQQCKGCKLVSANTHPDQLTISADSQSISVDSIRELSNFIHHSALQGGHKVVIIKDAEKMTHSAANALLKTLEEPNPNRYILLTCNDKSQLPATVLSRCSLQKVEVTDTEGVSAWLQTRGVDIKQYEWSKLFYGQPLKLTQWHEDDVLEKIEILYLFASNLKASHNFAQVQGVLTEHIELNSIFYMFINQQLKSNLQQGLSFEAYNEAQMALNRFMMDTQQILGLNQSLSLAKLVYSIQSAVK